MDRVAIGIDLGTSFCHIGIFKQNHLELICDEDGSQEIPSYIAFTEDDNVIFGYAAKSQVFLYCFLMIY